jgi:hypothetical protein
VFQYQSMGLDLEAQVMANPSGVWHASRLSFT